MSIVSSIVVVLLMLGILATIHELGHYFVAKLLKIKVYEVSIFVGPKLIRWKHKGVDFSIRLIPLGAYVRFNDVDNDGYVVESDNPDLLANQPRWKRLLVAMAGPFMNFVLGTLIFLGIFWVTGFTTPNIAGAYEGTQTGQYESVINEGDKIIKVNGKRVFTAYDLMFEFDAVSAKDEMTLTLKSRENGNTYEVNLIPEIRKRPMLLITVESMADDKPYDGWKIYAVDEKQNNGDPILKEGDYVTHINGKSVDDDDFDEYLYTVTDDVLNVTYIRDGETYEEEIIPEYADYASARGIALLGERVDSLPHFGDALGFAAKMPASIWNITVGGIRQIIEGKEEAYNLVSGPIGITTMVNDVVTAEEDTTADKLYMLVMLSAVISIALAFSNLLPIPGLDGVQIILIVVEMIIGRKLSEKAENRLTIIGFVMIILLALLALVSDILRIIFGY